ncbi:23S rRNA (guanosine(2251)-2'-O)-methyltransferase RlmB [Gulosibacter molinativorax]|uniref:23S rRNA (Guanosine(2251)-2'-O)-methyltransferase RlmB n=1 Tax=Gulosibacter molinativorax TaxID=256821 RepID=A0ABT7C3Y7_9MICO|nr:23S rRNA (guanosine(2251)-2'-O)-methyltransferase RlmB [Gulosibacter molinativorax]MDJ1369948.1 23S rRNA (guanosine(2251)-2'-O)-methyltransferase RlmB [Gulosibacter molinativorax]QUY63863.1 RNA 2'-O ribose methyltransferase substrate binding family protein [Gulosibacter molinativorax]
MSTGGKRPSGNRKKKGALKGTGGHGRKALEGKGPTPKAADRHWAKDRRRRAAAAADAAGKPAPQRRSPSRRPSQISDVELVTGRNSALEALRAGIPATTVYVAQGADLDDRMREIIQLAAKRNIPMLEVTRQELDRMVPFDAVHQGIALKVPAYEYADPIELLEKTISRAQVPLFVALDGITDPRNLGAIVRSVAAFGGHGVIVPQRRAAGMTASAWKTSAGAAARLPVALATNLTNTVKAFKDAGVFVIGLDGDGDVSLPGLELATSPLLVVVGSEGKGLSRLVAEHCDAIVSIPIDSATESLNAGIAASVTLYEVSKLRAEADAS